MDLSDKDKQIQDLTKKINELELKMKSEFASLTNRLYVDIDSIRIDISDLKDSVFNDDKNTKRTWCI